MQNTTPIPPQQPPIPVSQPEQAQQPIMQTAPLQPQLPEKSNKMLFLMLTTLIIIGLGIGGTFFYYNRGTTTPPQVKIETPIVSQVSPSPIPTQPTIPAQPTQTTEQALQDVTIVDPTTDMTDINADLSQL